MLWLINPKFKCCLKFVHELFLSWLFIQLMCLPSIHFWSNLIHFLINIYQWICGRQTRIAQNHRFSRTFQDSHRLSLPAYPYPNNAFLIQSWISKWSDTVSTPLFLWSILQAWNSNQGAIHLKKWDHWEMVDAFWLRAIQNLDESGLFNHAVHGVW